MLSLQNLLHCALAPSHGPEKALEVIKRTAPASHDGRSIHCLAVKVQVTALLEPRLTPKPDTHHVLHISRACFVDLQEVHNELDITCDKQNHAFFLPVSQKLPRFCSLYDTTSGGKNMTVRLLGH